MPPISLRAWLLSRGGAASRGRASGVGERAGERANGRPNGRGGLADDWVLHVPHKEGSTLSSLPFYNSFR